MHLKAGEIQLLVVDNKLSIGIVAVLLVAGSCHLSRTNSHPAVPPYSITDSFGAIIRMDTTEPNIYLIFSGHDHNEGRIKVLNTLSEKNVKASFFFTGDFYRNTKNKQFIESLVRADHYLGAHSDKHLLYADWSNRDSTLVSQDSFVTDLTANYHAMKAFGLTRKEATVFLPSYEWHNRDILRWTEEMGLTLINLTPAIGTARDYTWPEMGKRYTPSKTIFEDLMSYETTHTLNGAIILVHLGTDPRRQDKFYGHLGGLIDTLTESGYSFQAFSH